ncbi:hypothetical protein [Phenylobacterium sp.]|uniref:hypothetical protein n=1 Tax=Phenylobacterium sp. TaxID=1871053 RepID=UPI003983BC25
MQPADTTPEHGGEVIDFDEALLYACAADERADLIAEAELLAGAFAPDRRADELEAMAMSLSAGTRTPAVERARARRLAAALRRLAKTPQT